MNEDKTVDKDGGAVLKDEEPVELTEKEKFKKLEDYAKEIEAEVIATGLDDENLEIPILVVKKKRFQLHLDIFELRYEDEHIITKDLCSLLTDIEM